MPNATVMDRNPRAPPKKANTAHAPGKSAASAILPPSMALATVMTRIASIFTGSALPSHSGSTIWDAFLVDDVTGEYRQQTLRTTHQVTAWPAASPGPASSCGQPGGRPRRLDRVS